MAHPVAPIIGPDEVARLRSGVRIMALRALGDPDSADEVAQETIARLLTALSENRLQDHARIGGFASAIARNVITDVIRHRGRVDTLENLPEARESSGTDALSTLVSDEEAARVRVALGRLSDSDRHVLRLSFFDELSPADVAARMGESSERIRKRKSRALERLRQAFLGSPPGHETTTRPTVPLAGGAAGVVVLAGERGKRR